MDSLAPEVDVVALCDGDAIVHSQWLRELVHGLSTGRRSAVSGARWYSPTECGLAALSRHYWNALAIPTQQQHQIIWGGSLALWRSIVDEPAFRETFVRGFSDDAIIARYLHDTGRQCAVLDATYVVNTETIELGGYWNFLVRQMLCVRMNHPQWRPVLWHAIALSIGMAGLIPVLLLSDGPRIAVALAGLGVYGFTLLLLTSAYDARLRREFPERQALQAPVSWKRVAMALPALLFTAFVYPAATINAACLRRIRWRGVEYLLARGQVASTADCTEAPQPVAA
jgi:hypothetical protein